MTDTACSRSIGLDCRLAVVLTLAIFLVVPWNVAPLSAQKLPAGAVPVPPAEFYRIDEGVFALRPGMSVDLTDRKILLTMRQDWQSGRQDTTHFQYNLNGRRSRAQAGDRIDLKSNRATRDAVADKGSCFVDVVAFVAPRGAPPTATFRLSCI